LAATEPVAYVNAVAALRGGGEAEYLGGREVVEEAAVGRGLGMVVLVDNDHVVHVGERVSTLCRL
jgi:hypothetical protein